MFLYVASNYAKLSNCLICFLKKANLILLLVIPVLLSGFSNLFVSWTLVPKPPGSRHSQGFSSSKWGSGLLNGFCTVYRPLPSQERRVCLSLYLHLGTAHCSQQWLWLGVGIKHLQGSDFWGALQVQHWTLLRGTGDVFAGHLPVCTSWHSHRHPTQRVSGAWRSRIPQARCLPLGTQMSLWKIKLSRNFLFLLPAYCSLQALTRKYEGTVWISVFFSSCRIPFLFSSPQMDFQPAVVKAVHSCNVV